MATNGEADGRDVAQRAELAGLETHVLRARAVAAGATQADVDAADEGGEPRTFWIEYLLEFDAVAAAEDAAVESAVIKIQAVQRGKGARTAPKIRAESVVVRQVNCI
eukprot:SAG11_NODE_391_length_9839_cov_4.875257_2_plen_107_part_00